MTEHSVDLVRGTQLALRVQDPAHRVEMENWQIKQELNVVCEFL